MKKIKLLFGLLFVTSIMSLSTHAQVQLKYQTPPEVILKLADSPLTPAVSFDKNGHWMLLLGRSAVKSIEEVAAKEYRLAGLRINPKTNGSSRSRFYDNITLKDIATGKEYPAAGLPEKPKILHVSWSPDYQKVAFTITRPRGVQLWVLDIASKKAHALTKPVLNDIFRGSPFKWQHDGKALICEFVSSKRGAMPDESATPTGPIVQENLGKRAPARTYEDLLKSPKDEGLFDYFAASQLVRVGLDGSRKVLSKPAIISNFSVSPDGEYILIRNIHKPYSYLVPYYRFPATLQLFDKTGKFIKTVQELPLIEEMPQGFDAVQKGPRGVSWRDDKPASLYWVEALDGGNPRNKVQLRDAVYTTDYPFDLSKKRHLISVVNRFAGVVWGNDKIAVVYDRWRKNRSSNVYRIASGNPDFKPEIIFDLNTENLYKQPGSFVTTQNEWGRNVLLIAKKRFLYLRGQGYSPVGNRPFLDSYDLVKRKTNRLWRADGLKTYENIVQLLDVKKGFMVTSIQSETQNPQYYIRNFRKRLAPVQITHFKNPYESLTGVSKQFIRYKRADGVDLSATLYLPAGYNKEKDGPLPMLMWAYPREYKSKRTAGLVRTSPHMFMRINYGSPIFWVTRGFAILEHTEFPIIGVGNKEPNDTFVEQLVANAKAAIDAVVKMGVVDPDRVAVGGHSYGAFMVANLLTHCDLFAAGIARSGAYNRTLTPFGFQSEERTYWQAPKLYYDMSPFMHADIMKHPLLLIHGVADNNSGTFPIQSERYYNALKGMGATVRLVMLPAEMHGYAARESIMHVLWETDRWLMKYVKNKPKSK